MKKITLKLEKSKEKISPFAGSILIGDMLSQLRIGEYIDDNLPGPGSNRGLNPSEKVLPLIVSFMLGGSSFSDIDKLLAPPTDEVKAVFIFDYWRMTDRSYKTNTIVTKSEIIKEISEFLLLDEGATISTLKGLYQTDYKMEVILSKVIEKVIKL